MHDGKRSMHKLGIQVLPSPHMMAIIGAQDTLCEVAMLSICSEDMLAWQVRRGHLDRQIWQLIHFTRRDGVYGLEGHAVQGGHIFNIRLEDTLSHFTVEEFAAGFKKTMAFRAARHQAEQRLVRRGHLDHQIWQIMHFTRYGGVHGRGGQAVQP